MKVGELSPEQFSEPTEDETTREGEERDEENIERKREMECGKDVHQIITCMRHGPKEGMGDDPLAKNAEETIQKSVEDFSLTQDGIKILTSESKPDRCQKTGEIVSELVNNYEKRIHREIRPLTNPFSSCPDDKKLLIKIQKNFYPENYESLSLEEKKEINQEIENKTMVKFLEDRRFENSRVDAASRFAEWVKLLISASKWLPSKTEINLLNITHALNLLPFLKEAIIFKDGNNVKDMRAREFLEKIGGSIKPAEFFEIDVKRKDKDNFEAFLKFRGENYGLDFSRIEELAELAKQKRVKESK